MLFGIRHPEGILAGAEYSQMLAEHLDGKTRIYNPKNFKDYAETLLAYSPSQSEHLILVATHYDLISGEDSTDPYWRLAEIEFDNRGGSVWGLPTTRENITYYDELRDDPSILIKTAIYNDGKAKATRKVSRSVKTRGLTDPHTLVFGFNLKLTKLSNQGKFLLSSLPPYMAKDDEYGWAGFAFVPTNSTEKAVNKLVDWYSESTVVSLGDTWHEKLTEYGIAHNSVQAPPTTGKINGQSTYLPYGYHVREGGKRDYSTDLRSWKP